MPIQRTIYTAPLEALTALIRSLVKYEQQYRMSSADFYDRYRTGEMGDTADFVEWAGDYQHYIQLKEELEQKDEIIGRNSMSKQYSKQYVEYNEGVYRVAETRVSLDSIVYAFWDGQTTESIAQSFPVLTLEQVYGAIAFYLANRSEVDEYLKNGEADYETIRQTARQSDPMFYQKLAGARRQKKAVR